MKKIVSKAVSYPKTDVVILAGGQARRMNGINKLLQKFDHEIQFIKIHRHLKSYVAKVWVNSHRDHSIYKRIIPSVGYFKDAESGFLGPLMGMKSAWHHVQSDHVLFIPCDVTYIPSKVLSRLHKTLECHPTSEVAVVQLNGKALYPFCLMKRSALAKIEQHLKQGQRSLRLCFAELDMQLTHFKNQNIFFHSINSLEELQQHQQLNFL